VSVRVSVSVRERVLCAIWLFWHYTCV
jgi:hypothetical protein